MIYIFSLSDTESGTTLSESEVIKESVWTFLEDLLRNEGGPLHHQDPKIWTQIDSTTLEIIGGPDNIRQFVMFDKKNRFRNFHNYICLMNDLAKTINLCTRNSSSSPVFLPIPRVEEQSYIPSLAINPLVVPSSPQLVKHNPLLVASSGASSSADMGSNNAGIRKAVEEARAKENALFVENDKAFDTIQPYKEDTLRTNAGIG